MVASLKDRISRLHEEKMVAELTKGAPAQLCLQITLHCVYPSCVCFPREWVEKKEKGQ